MSDGNDEGVLEGAGSGTSGGAGLLTERPPLPTLLLQMLWIQLWELGPYAQVAMLQASLPQLSNGMLAIGASAVIAAVRLGRPQTVAIAKLTALMVKAEFVDFVAGVTSKIAQDCPECVAKVSIELTLMEEVEVLTRITKRMVDRGELTEAAIVAKEMAKHGHSEFLKMVAPEGASTPIEKAKKGLGQAGKWLKEKVGDDSGNADKGKDE